MDLIDTMHRLTEQSLGAYGLAVMAERNREKAAILYDYLDQSKLFCGTARKEDRSPALRPVPGDAYFLSCFRSQSFPSTKRETMKQVT